MYERSGKENFISVINRSNYNFLKCDWCINCRTLLKLVCKVVIGQCNQTVGCNQTTVGRQFY